jgi:hypothetical protein
MQNRLDAAAGCASSMTLSAARRPSRDLDRMFVFRLIVRSGLSA